MGLLDSSLADYSNEGRDLAVVQDPNYSNEGRNSSVIPDPNYSNEGRNSAVIPDPNYSNEGRGAAGAPDPNYSNEGRNSAVLTLPTISGAAGIADKFVSYATARVSTLIDEGYTAVNKLFGGVGPFSKLSSSAPKFSELSARAQLAAIEHKDPYYTTAASLSNADTSAVSAGAMNSQFGSFDTANTDHKIKLIMSETSYVEFDVMPEVTENRQVEYETMQPSQLLGEFHKYKGTKSTAWGITGVMVARTRDEAKRNLMYLNLLRGWTMPYFGEKQLQNFSNKLGAPPPVLTFSGWRGLVGPVPVVLTNVQWSWPKDVDWIPTGVLSENNQEIPFPVSMNITLALVESFSAEQFNGFDLIAFKNGRMVGAFQPLSRGDGSPNASEPTGGNQGVTNGVPEPYSNEGRNSIPPVDQATSDYSNEGRNSAVDTNYSNEGRNSVNTSNYSNEGRNYEVPPSAENGGG